MRIMQVLSGKGVNGAVLQCLMLTRALAARGHDMTLVCRSGSWIGNQLDGEGIRVVDCALRRWPWEDLQNMAEFVRREQIDLVHTHQSRAHFFGVLLRWMTKIPCVATAHARHLQVHWLFNDFVIANSEATFQFQRRWNLVPPDRMQVVNYLLDASCFDELRSEDGDRLRQQWNVDPKTRLAGIVGDLIPRKGQIHAVRAWPMVRDQLPHAKLVFVGIEKDARYTQLVRAEIDRLGVADDIIWAGYRTDIPAVMHALDVCVSAALEEALGLTIPEAMAAGRAVVATKVGGVPENIEDGRTGILVPPADPVALANALVRILADDQWRHECGQRAWHQVRAKYHGQRPLQQIEDIYHRVAAASRMNRTDPHSLGVHPAKLSSSFAPRTNAMIAERSMTMKRT